MKTILVTGGAGFVGSHACKALWAAISPSRSITSSTAMNARSNGDRWSAAICVAEESEHSTAANGALFGEADRALLVR